jgi:hypothetical protein
VNPLRDNRPGIPRFYADCFLIFGRSKSYHRVLTAGPEGPSSPPKVFVFYLLAGATAMENNGAMVALAASTIRRCHLNSPFSRSGRIQ